MLSSTAFTCSPSVTCLPDSNLLTLATAMALTSCRLGKEPELRQAENVLQLGDAREQRLSRRRPALLRVRVSLRHLEETLPELECRLSHRDSPGEEALADHVEHRHSLHLLDVLVALHVSKAVEERALGEFDVGEGDGGVVEV
eukprot:761273-Hanusia_phi.AAC.1